MLERDIKQVEDAPDLVRDMHSKAIVNTNSDLYNQRKIAKEKAKKQQREEADMRERMNRLEDQVGNMTSMMERLLEKLS